ncbi:MAG: CBS domain-containing protein, partial [Rhodospirillales bacterium]|nr:CBS domain-containing protein [Rhodospirillales bacterium]
TSGGVLAPLLMMGGAVGALLAMVIPIGTSGYWALIGMAAIMGGTMRSPLTSAIFALELTHNIDALLPLLIACTAAVAITVLLLKRSILTEKVARRGHHIVREYHADPFALTAVRDVMARRVDTLPAAMEAAEAVALLTAPGPHHKSYPVVDPEGRVVGMVSRADVLDWLRHPPAGTLGEIATREALVVAYPDEAVGDAADRMLAHETGRLPVIAREDDRLVGILARRDLLRVRQRVAEEEQRREGMWRPADGAAGWRASPT